MSALSVGGETGTVRPPGPESAAARSRENALSRGSAVVRSLASFGLAGAAVGEPAEDPLTRPADVPESSDAFAASSAGPASFGGGAESVVSLTASEPLRRFGGRLLPAEACAVEKPAVAGTVLVAPVSSAPLPPAVSGPVPAAAVVAAASVPVGSEGGVVHAGACGAVPGAVVAAVALLPVGAGSEEVGVHPGACGVAPGAVVAAASVTVELGSVAGTSVPGSAASVDVPSEAAGSVSGASAAAGEVSPSAAGEVSASGVGAGLLGAPEGSGGARSSARAVLTKIDAQTSAVSNAAVPPRNRSHRWSTCKATRFRSTGAPLAMAAIVLRARDYLSRDVSRKDILPSSKRRKPSISARSTSSRAHDLRRNRGLPSGRPQSSQSGMSFGVLRTSGATADGPRAPRTGAARSTVHPTTNRQSIESRARRRRPRYAAWETTAGLTASVRFSILGGASEPIPRGRCRVSCRVRTCAIGRDFRSVGRRATDHRTR